MRDIRWDIVALNGQVQVSRSEVKTALEGTIWLDMHASVIAESWFHQIGEFINDLTACQDVSAARCAFLQVIMHPYAGDGNV